MINPRTTTNRKSMGRGRAPLALSLVATLFFLVASSAWPGTGPQTGMLKEAAIKRGLQGENTPGWQTIAVFKVETVSTAEETKRGLAGRERMPQDRGLIFVLDEGQDNYFWMKGMKFPIDILFFSRGGRLLDILHSLDVCSVCPLFRAPVDTRYAIEINAGLADKFGLRPGNFLVISDGPSANTE